MPSTESYDRGRKFESYRTLPSLEEYVLVSQERSHVEKFLRQPEGAWLFVEVGGCRKQSRSLPSAAG